MSNLMRSFFRISGQPRSFLYQESGDYTVHVPQGTYRVILRGAGGSGGATGGSSATAGGSGGAGGAGALQVYFITFPTETVLDLHVGAKGVLVGGNGGEPGTASAASGGRGGDGGRPSWFQYNSNYYYANGGGGGGGGGGGRQGGLKYSPVASSSGGGGGGRYEFDSSAQTPENLIVSIPGGRGGSAWTGGASAGEDGANPNPAYRAGHGGASMDSAGVNAQGTSGGAGFGAGGGAGANYLSSHDYKSGGQGGGGNGGDWSAGGGTTPGAGSYNATNPTITKTVPEETAQSNARYGARADSGRGGLPDQDGNDGFIAFERVE